MTLAVTGAGGFIGSHVVSALLQRGYTIRALVHYNSLGLWGHLQSFATNPNPRLQIVNGDVTDTRCVEELAEGCDVFLHLAALIGIPYSYHAPESYLATNVRGTLNVLEACRKRRTKRLIVTSTSEVYGTAVYTPMDENHPLHAQSPYSATKIAADKFAEAYSRSFDLPVVILRPFNTYGPRQSARAVIPSILTQALSGEKEIHVGSVEPKRDLTYVDDTARAFVLAAEVEGIEGKTIHFGQGETIAVGDLAKLCLSIVGSTGRIVAQEQRRRPEKSEVGLLLCDASLAKRLLNWVPEVSLAEGLKHTAGYIREHLSEYRTKDYVI